MWMQQQDQSFLSCFPAQQPQQSFHPEMVGSGDPTDVQHRHRSTTMDSRESSNTRASRNLAEKQRRDNQNRNIATMAMLVPTVAGSQRKMDKITVLKMSTNFVRVHHTIGTGSQDFLPPSLSHLDFEQYIPELIPGGGFVIVLTTSGKIVHVSEPVEKYFGHPQLDVIGLSLYDFIDEEDHENLMANLTPDEMQSTMSSTVQNTEIASESSSSSEDSMMMLTARKPFQEQRRCFVLKLSKHAVSKSETTVDKCLQFSGTLRLADARRNPQLNASRARHRDMIFTSNDIIFVGVVQLIQERPLTQLSITDTTKEEYVTRHLVDGRIIFCDHRVSVVAGYLAQDVSGRSAFSFMHKDDSTWTMIGLRQMYYSAETCGSSCYRLYTKNGNFIYLLTHGYLEYDEKTQIALSFVCVNTLVPKSVGIQLVKDMKKRFSATVSDSTRAMIQNGEDSSIDMESDSQTSDSKSSLTDPSQLDKAIAALIASPEETPLPSPTITEELLPPSPVANTQFKKAADHALRMPPAEVQANSVGIKMTGCVTVHGKGSRTPKRESKIDCRLTDQSSSSKLDSFESLNDGQSVVKRRLSSQGNTRSLGKSTGVYKLQNETYKGHGSPQDLTIPGTSRLDGFPSANVTNSCGPIEQTIKSEPSPIVLNDSSQDSLRLSESGDSYPLKRICNDEDGRPYKQKKHCDEQGSSYDWSPAINGDFPGLSTEFNRYNQHIINSQLPNLSLYEGGSVDFPKDDAGVIPNTNREIMIKLLEQIADNNANPDELSMTHREFANSISFLKPQIDDLARDLEKNPALQAQRDKLTQYQVEYNKQNQILQTLQQDCRNIQINMKRSKSGFDIGV